MDSCVTTERAPRNAHRTALGAGRRAVLFGGPTLLSMGQTDHVTTSTRTPLHVRAAMAEDGRGRFGASTVELSSVARRSLLIVLGSTPTIGAMARVLMPSSASRVTSS